MEVPNAPVDSLPLRECAEWASQILRLEHYEDARGNVLLSMEMFHIYYFRTCGSLNFQHRRIFLLDSA